MGVCLGVLCKPDSKTLIYDINMSPKKNNFKKKERRVAPEK